ncbi:unnamed protein product [Albugo candida]|uniref:Uncharacterized protein n=1 Tax=Albugo candida TaxID=65357 RepID=A0A024GM62_9STRA|nr:unnamed protein product [Albugo candida]|eukprot:CCI47946.1 unnamed protein product [Albugo candida]
MFRIVVFIENKCSFVMRLVRLRHANIMYMCLLPKVASIVENVRCLILAIKTPSIDTIEARSAYLVAYKFRNLCSHKQLFSVLSCRNIYECYQLTRMCIVSKNMRCDKGSDFVPLKSATKADTC